MIDLYRRWMDRARCAGMDTSVFFTDSNVTETKRATKKNIEADEAAKKICRRCPVMEQCRRDTIGELYGVWGGLDQGERRTARKLASSSIRVQSDATKRRIGKMILSMRDSGVSRNEIQRIVGLDASAVQYLEEWEGARRARDKASRATVIDLPVRRKPGPLRAEEIERILQLRSEGKSLKIVASLVGCGRDTVMRILREERESHGSTA